jgi:hypothetical protein
MKSLIGARIFWSSGQASTSKLLHRFLELSLDGRDIPFGVEVQLWPAWCPVLASVEHKVVSHSQEAFISSS